jgi:hypothetical protein
LVVGGKYNEILKSVMEEWYEFIVTGQKLPLPDVLDKVVPMSDRFFCRGCSPVLSASAVSCKRGFNFAKRPKTNLGHPWR